METKIVLQGKEVKGCQINEGTRYTIDGFIKPPAKKEKKK
jgi:hypothetical protein